MRAWRKLNKERDAGKEMYRYLDLISREALVLAPQMSHGDAVNRFPNTLWKRAKTNLSPAQKVLQTMCEKSKLTQCL